MEHTQSAIFAKDTHTFVEPTNLWTARKVAAALLFGMPRSVFNYERDRH